MYHKFNLELTREAISRGGDRYETKVRGERKPWVIYVPQTLSRRNDRVRQSLVLTIESTASAAGEENKRP